MAFRTLAALARHDRVREILRFGVVGVSSTVIDLGLLNLLHYTARLPLAAAATLSFFVAACNGFYWHRRWTFRATEGKVARQYPRFLTTYITGWGLNVLVMTLALVAAARLGLTAAGLSTPEVISAVVARRQSEAFSPLAVNAATLTAGLVVACWNYTVSRLWAFRRH